MTTESITEFFEKDHREIDAIFEKLSFKDAATDHVLFEEFDRRLERHIHWEEEILFPTIGAISPMIAQGPVRVMKLEHDAIRHSKAKSKVSLKQGDLNGFREHCVAVRATLEQHNFKEERILYPSCDQSLDQRAVAEVFSKMKVAGS